MSDSPPTVSYKPEHVAAAEGLRRVRELRSQLAGRRSVRDFSDEPVPIELIEEAIRTAAGAPSGANVQPWTFVVVSDPETKRRIREGAEKEEYENYHGRMPAPWLEDLKPLQTDWHKEFLERAPHLIAVFRQDYRELADGRKKPNYYIAESVGIACGFLLVALHRAGLAALTHTPSPMAFLNRILGRPKREKPFLLIPVGYPATDCRVPDIPKKSFEDVAIFWRLSAPG
jgi:iodotyrosine deiodinase